MSDTAVPLAANASSVVASQTSDDVGVLSLFHRAAWRNGAALMLLVAALLFICSRKVVSSSAGRLTVLLKELGRKRSRIGVGGVQITSGPDEVAGDEEEQRDVTRRRGKKSKGSSNQVSPPPARTQQQTFELEPLIRTDSNSSTTPSGDELTSPTSPTSRQLSTFPLPSLHIDHQQLQPLLSTRLQSALLPYLPPILSHVPQWQLVYSTSVHGHSLSTLYQRSSVLPATVCDGALLVCRDSDGWVFGCWTSERWERRELYYGGSESFVFTWQPTFKVYEAREETRRKKNRGRRLSRDAQRAQHEVDGMSAEGEQQGEEADDEEEEEEEKVVGMSGAGYYQLAKNEHIALGGGERFALWLDSAFRDGTSGPCSTFDSPTLSKRAQFKCYELEVWSM